MNKNNFGIGSTLFLERPLVNDKQIIEVRIVDIYFEKYLDGYKTILKVMWKKTGLTEKYQATDINSILFLENRGDSN